MNNLKNHLKRWEEPSFQFSHLSKKGESSSLSPPPPLLFFNRARNRSANSPTLKERRGEERDVNRRVSASNDARKRNDAIQRREKLAARTIGVNWASELGGGGGRGRGRPAPGNLPAAQRFRPSEKRPEPRPNTRGGDRFHVNYIGECAVEFVVLAERRGEGEGSFKATVNLSADAVSYARHFSLTVGGLGKGWPIPGTLFMEIKKGGWPKFSLRYRFQLFETCNLTGQCTIDWYFYPKLDRAVWKYCF